MVLTWYNVSASEQRHRRTKTLSYQVALLGDVQVEIRDASLGPDIEEVDYGLTGVTLGVEASEVYGRERAVAALQVGDGVGNLSHRDRVGLLGGHFPQEGEVEYNRGVAPRAFLPYEPPLIEMQDGLILNDEVEIGVTCYSLKIMFHIVLTLTRCIMRLPFRP